MCAPDGTSKSHCATGEDRDPRNRTGGRSVAPNRLSGAQRRIAASAVPDPDAATRQRSCRVPDANRPLRPRGAWRLRTAGEPVGVARYVQPVDDPEAADVAVAVIDAWQGRGLRPPC